MVASNATQYHSQSVFGPNDSQPEAVFPVTHTVAEPAQPWRRAIVFLSWGERYVGEVLRCIERSKLPNYPIILITDQQTPLPPSNLRVVRVDFALKGLLRKSELARHLPEEFDSYLFLDSDTIVLDDISLGFEMAEAHGIAMAPAPHYNLEAFWGFGNVMDRELVARRGQLQYNTGVIFFRRTPEVWAVFDQWQALAVKHASVANDQPFLSLAMYQLSFNPYTLSPSYNIRGLGELISGSVRIWHSHGALPDGLNDLGIPWPLRRVLGVDILRDGDVWQRVPRKVKRHLRRLRKRLQVPLGSSSART